MQDRQSRRAWCGLLTALLLCSACDKVREIAGMVGELKEISDRVGILVGDKQVGVSLNNGKHLQVSLLNSPLKNLPPEEKRRKALEIAGLAYKSYSGRSGLETVSVVFRVEHTYLLIVHYRDSSDTFSFTPAELTPQIGRASCRERV